MRDTYNEHTHPSGVGGLTPRGLFMLVSMKIRRLVNYLLVFVSFNKSVVNLPEGHVCVCGGGGGC